MFDLLLFLLLKFLLLILVALWFTIAGSILYRKRRRRKKNAIENTFAEVASIYLYPLPNEKWDLVKMQRKLREVGIVASKPRNVQYLIDLMIRTQRNLLGENYFKLEKLYAQIPPFRASINKVKNKKWYVKARGIREIYEMDQDKYLKEILKERNNKNIYVRREAQIAMVVFLGWESLRFLPYLKREMTLWQQIKVVEKLHDLYPEPKIEYLQKAYSSEKPYAQELLMRIIRKFNLSSEIDFILEFIDHPLFDKRESAIYCISSFNLDQARLKQLKEKFYNIPNTEQQIHLLKYMDRITEEKDIDFYKNLLYTANDIIKLSAAEILWNSGHVEEVQEFYYHQYSKQPVQV